MAGKTNQSDTMHLDFVAYQLIAPRFKGLDKSMNRPAAYQYKYEPRFGERLRWKVRAFCCDSGSLLMKLATRFSKILSRGNDSDNTYSEAGEYLFATNYIEDPHGSAECVVNNDHTDTPIYVHHSRSPVYVNEPVYAKLTWKDDGFYRTKKSDFYCVVQAVQGYLAKTGDPNAQTTFRFSTNERGSHPLLQDHEYDELTKETPEVEIQTQLLFLCSEIYEQRHNFRPHSKVVPEHVESMLQVMLDAGACCKNPLEFCLPNA